MKVNKVFLLLIIIFFMGCNMLDTGREQAFTISGDSEILNKMVINVQSERNDSRYTGYSAIKIQTLLYNNQLFQFENDYIFYYTIYFSYENKVGELSFDNLAAREKCHLNHLHVFEEDGGIKIKYFGTQQDIDKERAFGSKITIPLEDFFRENNILDENEQKDYKNKFFNFYNPITQEYALLPLDKLTIEHYKSLTLEEKKKYELPIELAIEMGIPQEEIDEILKYYKENKITP